MKNLNLSKKQEEVLTLLADSSYEGLYGLELVEKSGGTLKRGTIYVTLTRMQDQGLVTSEIVETPTGEKGPPRRRYKLTGTGVKVYEAWSQFNSAVMAIA